MTFPKGGEEYVVGVICYLVKALGDAASGAGEKTSYVPSRRFTPVSTETAASHFLYIASVPGNVFCSAVGLEFNVYKAMMGEYIIYYRGKIVGGIYDDRFLVKPTQSAKELMPEADLELPYDGAKEMLLVDNVDNKAFLRELLEAMYDELPAPKKKK